MARRKARRSSGFTRAASNAREARCSLVVFLGADFGALVWAEAAVENTKNKASRGRHGMCLGKGGYICFLVSRFSSATSPQLRREDKVISGSRGHLLAPGPARG